MNKPQPPENVLPSQPSSASRRAAKRKFEFPLRKRVSEEQSVPPGDPQAADAAMGSAEASSSDALRSSSDEASLSATPPDFAKGSALPDSTNESAPLAAMAISLMGGSSVLPIAGGLAAVAGIAAAVGGGGSSARHDASLAQNETPSSQAPGGGTNATGSSPEAKDTIAPVAPVILLNGTSADPSIQTGIVSGTGTQGDPILINKLGTIHLTLEPNADWSFSLDGGKTWKPGVNSGIPGDEITEGKSTIQIVQVDPSGNVSPVTTIDVVKDTTAPDAPRLDLARSSTNSQMATVVGSGTTGDPVLISSSGKLAVATEEGATWRYSMDGGTTWKTGTADGIAAPDLLEGDNVIQVVQMDRAGNTSEPYSFTVTKDTITPTEPVVDLTAYGGGTVLLNGSGALNVANEPGAEWRFSLDGGQTWNIGAGNFLSVTELAEGGNSVQILQADRAGNASAATTIEVVKDSIAAKLSVSASNFAGYASDGLVVFNSSQHGQIIFNNVEPGGHIEYVGGSYGLPDFTADGNNVLGDPSWSGRYALEFRQVDSVGNVSEYVHVEFYVNSLAREQMDALYKDIATPVERGTTAIIG